MTSLNSSISSSEARRYVLVLMGSVVAMLLTVVLLCQFGIRAGLSNFAFYELYAYQLEKLERTQRAELLLLGDSSLGNAIDAELLSRLSGVNVLNLALTGAYGYAGSYNLLARALDHLQPKYIVLVHTADMMTRPVSWLGFLHTASHWTFLTVPLEEQVRFYLNPQTLGRVVENGWKRWRGQPIRPPLPVANDYIAQRAPLDAVKVFQEKLNHPLERNRIVPENMEFLRRIAVLCQQHGLTCVYQHGPMPKPRCDNSLSYLTQVGQLVERTGLLFEEGLICLNEDELGDSDDHVHPGYKKEVTQRYYERLRRYFSVTGK